MRSYSMYPAQKAFHLLVLAFLLGGSSNVLCAVDPPAVDPSLLRAIIAHEMDIHLRADGRTWSTRARAKGLRFEMDVDGLHVFTTDTASIAGQHFTNGRWGRSNAPLHPVLAQHPTLEARRLVLDGPGIAVEYVHSDAGLRQNFIVHERPTGSSFLVIDRTLEGDLTPVQRSKHAIAFLDADLAEVFSYEDLRVWDAHGTPLEARLLLLNGDAPTTVRIEVDDTNAVYPITVDPVSTTPNRLLLGPQQSSEFGIAVATAGDLNGDGYSDVVIGAWLADIDYPNSGAAYVFYGGNGGIGAVADQVLLGGQQGAQFGCSASTAGDVNGDGFSDLIVGARTWESNIATELSEGAAFVYYGSATGIALVPDLILQPNHAGDNFGSNVACLGDINGDNYSDVIVSAYLAEYPSYQEGVAFVYLGGAAGLSAVPVHRLEPQQAGAHFARSVSGAGDINGDGYDDVIVGAAKWVFTAGANDQGAAFIWYGSAGALGGFNPPYDLMLVGSGQNLAAYGWSVAGAGDVNGDGYSDVAVSAYRDNYGQANEGAVYVYHGAAAGLDPTVQTMMQSNQDNAWMGRWISSAGDVNGDGYSDLLIGSPQYSSGQSLEGIVGLYFGSAIGLPPTANILYQLNNTGANLGECVSTAGDVNGDGYSDIILGAKVYGNSGAAAVYHGGPYYMDLTSSLISSGGAANMELGSSISNAGDVNGDGYADVIVGAPLASNGQANEGVVRIHYGSSIGPAGLPDAVIEANIAGAEFGASVCSAGDVNGDGYADVIIGSPFAGIGGRASIHHGSPGGVSLVPARTLFGPAGSEFGRSVSAAGDVNSDGYADVIVGAPGSGQVMVYLGTPTGTAAAVHVTLSDGGPATSYGYDVGTAGDVNGDGYSDVIIGAPDQANGQTGEGVVYIYHGSITGIVTPYASRLELDQANAAFGTSVAGAGDTDGDGYFDVIIGAPYYDNGQIDEGAAFVFYGSPAGVPNSGSYLMERNVANAAMGMSVAEAGDINGDGYADVVIGSPLYESSGAETDEGQIVVYHGSPTGITTIGGVDNIQSNVAGNRFGHAVSGGGDVDGDGYSDVLGGEPAAAPGFVAEGSWRWHRGNRGYSLGRPSRQYMSNLVSPLATNCMDFSNPDFFGIGHLARSPFHRCRARLQWEVVFEGQPFTGGPITNSVANTGVGAAWTSTGIGGTEIKELIYKTAGYIRYKWRVRVEYHPASMIDGQRYSRWFYGFASGIGDIGVLPVELVEFQAYVAGEVNRVEWATATENTSDHFIVERSTDLEVFQHIGTVPAAGQSQSLLVYSLDDTDPPHGISYYRLLLVDQDGAVEYTDAVSVYRDAAHGGTIIFPNPVVGTATLVFNGEYPARISLVDAIGRHILALVPTDDPLHRVDLDLVGVAPGQYTLILEDGHGNVTDRVPLIKQ